MVRLLEYHPNRKKCTGRPIFNGDNEFGLLERFDTTGTLIKKMMCDSMAICRTFGNQIIIRHMKKIDILFHNVFFALIVTGVYAQISGKTSFSFLNMPPSARITGLGGSVIGVSDDDINLSASNPANLNTKMAKQFSFSHGFHFA